MVKLTRTRRTYVVAAAVGALVTAANASQGAYFSQSWGWVALAFLVPTSVLLIVDGASAPGRLRAAFAGLMVAFGVWIALSATWSISSAASIREVERMLVYVALALAVALVLRRGDGPAVLAGIALGVTLVCTYALATRLLPDRLHTFDDAIDSYRLAAPLGYWNSLGLLAVLGVLAALGFVAHARRTPLALAAAAAVPITSMTLYFTFSRGAWAALMVGRRRRRRARSAADPAAVDVAPRWSAVRGVHRVRVDVRSADERERAGGGRRTGGTSSRRRHVHRDRGVRVRGVAGALGLATHCAVRSRQTTFRRGARRRARS